MPYEPLKKKTLLIQSGSTNKPDGFHLHIILTDACRDGCHLIGSVGSVYPGQFHDPACLIQAGEHSFITHESYFAYRRLQTLPGKHIATCVDGWVYQQKEPISEALYLRICAGIHASMFSPRGMKTYWDANK